MMLQVQEPLKVFLCHGSEDKVTVRSLYQRLRQDGFSPWLDEKDLIPGQNWGLEIKKAVRDSDVVVVCLSASSASRKGFAQKEIRIALDEADKQPEGELYVIPLRLEAFQLPERLQQWHWVNFFEKDGYEKLIESLRLKSGRPPKRSILQRDRHSDSSDVKAANSSFANRDLLRHALLLTVLVGLFSLAAATLGPRFANNPTETRGVAEVETSDELAKPPEDPSRVPIEASGENPQETRSSNAETAEQNRREGTANAGETTKEARIFSGRSQTSNTAASTAKADSNPDFPCNGQVISLTGASIRELRSIPSLAVPLRSQISSGPIIVITASEVDGVVQFYQVGTESDRPLGWLPQKFVELSKDCFE